MIYPVKGPSQLERLFHDAGLVALVPLATIYDIKARTSIQQAWQNPGLDSYTSDIYAPAHWNDKLFASMRGEFFSWVLRDASPVLDIGCGEGWPSLYLARNIAYVTGIDISAEYIRLAQSTASLLSLANVTFQVADIEHLPFADGSFKGVCFGGNVFTYQSDPVRMLNEIHRVLAPNGVFALEQWPIDPQRPPWERILWFIDGGSPILHYGAGSGLFSRSYFIYFKPSSPSGRQLCDVATRMGGELTTEQQHLCEGIKACMERGNLSEIEKVLYAGEDCSLAAEQFPALLADAGFANFTSWGLPDAVEFARSLAESHTLARLSPEDLLPCLRALVRSAPKCQRWVHTWCSCMRA
jgi:SAM-dependent methyltransferase